MNLRGPNVSMYLLFAALLKILPLCCALIHLTAVWFTSGRRSYYILSTVCLLSLFQPSQQKWESLWMKIRILLKRSKFFSHSTRLSGNRQVLHCVVYAQFLLIPLFQLRLVNIQWPKWKLAGVSFLLTGSPKFEHCWLKLDGGKQDHLWVELSRRKALLQGTTSAHFALSWL